LLKYCANFSILFTYVALSFPINPEDESQGKRIVPFTREIYIEREDFMEEPAKGFFRLSPGTEVRLRYAYYIKCTNVVKDDNGNIIELHCTHDPATKGGWSQDGRKVKSTLHWVPARHAVKAIVRIYDNLFLEEDTEEDNQHFIDNINPDSLKVIENALIEPALAKAEPFSQFQFERIGYFCCDPDSTAEKLVFNRTVTLKDAWARMQKK